MDVATSSGLMAVAKPHALTCGGASYEARAGALLSLGSLDALSHLFLLDRPFLCPLVEDFWRAAIQSHMVVP